MNMRLVALLGVAAGLTLATGTVAAQSTGSGEASTKSKNERLICQSVEETGSLARRRRQCFTRAEWDRIAEAARARGQRLTSDMTSAGAVSN
ncbi:MAG TPA: hypothetical protein VFO69_10130 [Allosphingosinicella sp.]|nr:hypothetical protein [Allosphingosinicella sp.]